MKRFILLLVTLFAMTNVMAQLQPDMPIPADKEVRVGRLENGMTYYIRHNEKPKGQASFYIFHHVGAVQEEDSQQGLAHFLEHMAFNGTKNLPGKKMIEYLERNGVKFGADLNAYTSYDETCYNLDNVPTANPATIDTALLILHDWSQFISLEPQEINNERGVIMEELRTRDGAGWRAMVRRNAAVNRGSKYEQISRSICTGSGLDEFQSPRQRSRPVTRITCVSTGNPGTPNALPSTTLAVLRPTPGNVTSESIVSGTSPSKRSRSTAANPSRCLVLER